MLRVSQHTGPVSSQGILKRLQTLLNSMQAAGYSILFKCCLVAVTAASVPH
jgi:hypothetical protein